MEDGAILEGLRKTTQDWREREGVGLAGRGWMMVALAGTTRGGR
jgi:hypothetical protein